MRMVPVLFSLTLFAIPSAQAADDAVKFPANYRETMTNYLSLDRTQNPDQVIRLYANDVAMQGPGADGKLPFGSILVAEVYKAKKDDAGQVLKSELGRRIRDKFALVAVMQREEGWGDDLPEGLRNENWEMGAFKPDGSGAGKNLNSCRACHAPLVATHHLFSMEHLRK
ncbi:MAG: cytochrome P460 family protein [Pseudomonadota bacterium]